MNIPLLKNDLARSTEVLNDLGLTVSKMIIEIEKAKEALMLSDMQNTTKYLASALKAAPDMQDVADTFANVENALIEGKALVSGSRSTSFGQALKRSAG